MAEVDNLILGAGLAGLSASYHLGHNNCVLLEAKPHPFGHIHTHISDGFTWDEGPHVSFTQSEYVRELFADSVAGEFEEYEVVTGNYYQGHWIEHPAQSNLYQVPEPLRSQCLESFLESRDGLRDNSPPVSYREWLHQAFGPVFADTFPAAYTRKYWTLDPVDLSTEWVGARVFKPSVDDVVKGSKGPLDRQTHYIKKVRYPTSGGYQAFARKLYFGAKVYLNTDVVSVDLDKMQVYTKCGEVWAFNRLVNTIPLPVFIRLCRNVPDNVLVASDELLCSSIALVNVRAPHPTLRNENWMYVYDESKLSTRINCTEKLSSRNAPDGWTGVQVEVYHSRAKPLQFNSVEVADRVIDELSEMGLVDYRLAGGRSNIHADVVPVQWANVIFHHQTKPALEIIYQWLSSKGMAREEGDTEALTDWNKANKAKLSTLYLAGRFGQWKYYWTDDCVLRGKQLVAC